MAVTRINNNQITDAASGNTLLGVNAAVKLQNYSITSQKIANNLTYGSDLTISGNLIVNGNTTTVNTTVVDIEDPMITLAYNQVGSPTLDIGFIGVRGSANNIAWVWQESAQEFVAAYTSDNFGNSTITLIGYANIHAQNANIGGNLTIGGNIDITGNVANLQVTGNITGGNLLTAGLVSATGNVTGGNVTTSGLVSATGNVSGGNVLSDALVQGTTLSASGNVIGGNVSTSGQVTATGNVTGGNLLTGGLISATSNVTGGNVLTSGLVSATGNVSGGNVLSDALVQGTTLSASGNVIGGNVTTGGLISATGDITGGNVATGGTVSATANITGGNILTGGQVSATGNVTGNYFIGNGSQLTGVSAVTSAKLANGTSNVDIPVSSGNITFGVNGTGDVVTVSTAGLQTSGILSATGNVTGGNVLTGGLISATSTITSNANITGGNLLTGGEVSATANVIGGNVLTGGLISATGNIDGGNVMTTGIVSAGGNVQVGNLNTAGSVSATGNITGAIVNTDDIVGTAVTITSNGAIYLSATGNIDANSQNIVNVADPANPQDAATKAYVDSVAEGLNVHSAVIVATTAALDSLSMVGNVAYDNGVANDGVGATLTITTTSQLILDTIDLSTLSANARVLVKNEVNPPAGDSDAAWNGIYVVTSTGALSTVLTRSTDFDGTPASQIPSAYTFVETGATYADTGWVCTTNSGYILGTTPILWSQFSGAGSYTAGSGLSLTGTQFNALTDGVTTTINGSNQISVKASANLTTPNIGDATGSSLSVTGNITGANLIVSSNETVTGNITGGNLLTGGLVSATSNVIGGNITTVGLISASGNITGANISGANLYTGGEVSATGNVTGGNVNTTLVSATGNVVGGNVTTGGLITATGNITGGNLLTGGLISSTGNITGANISGANIYTGGEVSATGNVTGGNVLTGGLISATSTITSSANITGGNILTGGLISATGNIDGGNINGGSGLIVTTGNISGGNVNATESVTGNIIFGQNIYSNAQVSAVGNVVGANISTSGLITATGNITGGNVDTSGLITATGNITGGNILTDGLISAQGSITSDVTITGGNIETGGTVSATGNITGGNITTAGALQGGNIVISGDDITDTNGRVNFNSALDTVDFAINGTAANIFYVDATTNTVSFGNSTQTTGALVSFNTPTSILFPVGNVGQRPATGVTGMVRFNTTNNNLEVYDNSQWTAVGVPSFTVIADEQFNGDGSTVAFTLTTTQTTNSCIVSINGVVQIPGSAYSVSGIDPTCVLTFTEAPLPGDLIDVRQITTTTSVTSISNLSGNAVVSVSDTSATTTVTGDLSVTGNVNIAGNVATNQINNGTSAVQIPTAGGNVNIDVGATDNMAVFTATALSLTGNIIPTANITYDLGTSTRRWKDLWLSNSTIYLGNSQISANATSLIFTNPQGGQTVFSGVTPNITASTVSASGNVTGGNVLTTGVVSAGANVTGANVLTTGVVSAGANVTGANLLTGGLVTATGNITGGNIVTGGLISATGNITGGNILGGANVNATTHTGTTVSVSANITGGNVLTGGLISATSTITSSANVSANNVTSTNWVTAANVSASGNIFAAGYLSVAGNLYVANIISQQQLVVDDPLLYLTANVTYPYNYTIGFYSAFTGGAGNTYQHTGLFRDYTDSTWKLASNLPEPTGSSIDFTNAIYDQLKSGNVLSTGLVSATGNITGGNILTAGIMSSTGNATHGNVLTGGLISATGNITGGNILGGANVNATTHTGATVSVSGNITGGNVLTGGLISATGAITGASLSVSTGTVTLGNIVNSNANGVGNIGSSTTYFNTVFAKATSAQYADLAEKYVADAEYAPGTVVVFGGTHEVTVNAVDGDRKVAGVVSTNPSYIMNGGLEAEHVATVALTGRVPCFVIGPVRKGDMMVAAGLGRARAEADPKVGTVIGKALEDFDGAEGTIEVVVGRF